MLHILARSLRIIICMPEDSRSAPAPDDPAVARAAQAGLHYVSDGQARDSATVIPMAQRCATPTRYSASARWYRSGGARRLARGSLAKAAAGARGDRQWEQVALEFLARAHRAGGSATRRTRC